MGFSIASNDTDQYAGIQGYCKEWYTFTGADKGNRLFELWF